MILCPFLTQKIPSDIFLNYRCLIVHPGIEGDRGPSSLDWAINAGLKEWGVTIIQASEKMDAGDVWGTKEFPLRQASKTSIYKREVTEAAMALLNEALINIESGSRAGRPLDYSNPAVKGSERPLMRQKDRAINWRSDSTKKILRKINSADTRPGVRDTLEGVEVFLFGAVSEPELHGAPGEIIAVKNGAFCRATKDGAVWIKQLQLANKNTVLGFKMPATMLLGQILAEDKLSQIGVKESGAIDEIWTEVQGDIAYFYFDFYNGAMNTQQCMEMKAKLVALKKTQVKVIVFMGGENFFSNGIHLNCIEASGDAGMESWRNINAIDDLVYEMINTPDQITISALSNNAGAGGAIMALACDEVIIREGVVVNPHYKSMGLYGSEYWTYLLPNRVGPNLAERIAEECEPMSAKEALKVGFADLMFEEPWDEYHQRLVSYCGQLLKNVEFKDFINVKRAELNRLIDTGKLSQCRSVELAKMKATFDDPYSEYHRARHRFVNKLPGVKGCMRNKKRSVSKRLKQMLFQKVG